jgi:hypothetical protein
MASMQTRMRITYQTPMVKIIKYSEKSFKPTIDSDEGMDKTSDERRQVVCYLVQFVIAY